MPTDTKLKNLVINYLTKEQYDAIPTPNENELYLTSDMPSSGGGGVSPCLNLMDMNNGSVRTSITEEEKTNLEKGLYNSVLYMDYSSPETAEYMAFFPETAISADGTFGFSAYSLSLSESSGVVISGSSIYAITIGEKSTDGTYPITIEKQIEAPFGGGSGGGGGGGAIEEIEATHEASAADYIYKLSKEPTSDVYILKLPIDAGNGATISMRVLMTAYNNSGDSKRVFFGLASLTIFSAFCISISSNGTEVSIDARSPLPPTITEDKDDYVLTAVAGAGGSARWEPIPRYCHTITLKTPAGSILWTQTLYHPKNTEVNSYDALHSMFGRAVLAGNGEYAQLNLHGGNVDSDRLIKLDGTSVTLASLGTIVYTDDRFFPS